MNGRNLIEAFKLASKSAFVAGVVTAAYGVATKDYGQVIPAVIFSFGTAMGVSGYYDRKLSRLEV